MTYTKIIFPNIKHVHEPLPLIPSNEHMKEIIEMMGKLIRDDIDTAIKEGTGTNTKKKNHLCHASVICICYPLALEPDEQCPVHGHGSWPPRCGRCGRYFKREWKEYPYPKETQKIYGYWLGSPLQVGTDIKIS